MRLPAMAFAVTEWSKLSTTVHPGETGEAIWSTVEVQDLRLRVVEYSPEHLSDHWCDRGHVLFVLEGELIAELRDGRHFVLRPGMSFQVSDFGDHAHRIYTKSGAKAFILD